MKKNTKLWVVPLLQIAIAGVQFLLTALIVDKAGAIDSGILSLVGTIIAADTAMAGGFLLGKVHPGNALVNGGMAACFVLAVLALGALAMAQPFTVAGLWKALAVLLAGELGAILAVLQKKRVAAL